MKGGGVCVVRAPANASEPAGRPRCGRPGARVVVVVPAVPLGAAVVEGGLRPEVLAVVALRALGALGARVARGALGARALGCGTGAEGRTGGIWGRMAGGQ